MVGGVEEAWVDVGVEEAGDGEDCGEDGDCRRERKGQGSAVVVDDAERWLASSLSCLSRRRRGNIHGDGEEHCANLRWN